MAEDEIFIVEAIAKDALAFQQHIHKVTKRGNLLESSFHIQQIVERFTVTSTENVIQVTIFRHENLSKSV